MAKFDPKSREKPDSVAINACRAHETELPWPLAVAPMLRATSAGTGTSVRVAAAATPHGPYMNGPQ